MRLPIPPALRLAALPFLLALLGCASSPPVDYLDLEVVPPPSGSATPLAGAPLEVGRVTLPPELDRDELVRRTGAGRLEIVPSERWAAPLADLVRRTLAFDLAARLPPRQVVLPGEPRPPGPVRIVVVVLRQLATGGDGALLAGRWSIVDGDAGTSLAVHDVELGPADGAASGPGLAHATSVALGELADRISAELAAHESSAESRP